MSSFGFEKGTNVFPQPSKELLNELDKIRKDLRLAHLRRKKSSEMTVEGVKAAIRLGGSEGQAIWLQICQVLPKQEAEYSQGNLEAVERVTKQLITDALSVLATTGIIGALFLSIVVPLIFLSAEVSNESVNFFGELAVTWLERIFYHVLVMTFWFSMVSLFLSVRMYLITAQWLNACTYEGKIWYLRKTPLVMVVILYVGAMTCFFIAMPFGVAVYVSPTAALLCVIFLLLFIYICLETVIWNPILNPTVSAQYAMEMERDRMAVAGEI